MWADSIKIIIMIFVTLGTFLSPFSRPLKQLHELCEKGIINEEVIVQCGHTIYESKHLTLFPFLAPKDMQEYIDKARIVITHAGTGSLVQPVKLSKKVIAIPRLFELDEHVDDHQLDIFGKFVEYKYVYPWNRGDDLEKIMNAIEDFVPEKFQSTRDEVIKYLEDYIDNL